MSEAAIRVASYRAETEDRAEIFSIGTATILIVADGAGGRPGGAAAAEGVVRWVRQHASRIECRDPRDWCKLLAEVDHVLQRDPEAGETTAVVLAVSPDGIAGASAGDSEAWLIGSDGHVALTERQRAKPFFGTGMAKPVSFQARASAGKLLVATDGLFKYADDGTICATVRDLALDDAAARLVELVRRPSGTLPDDVAILLWRLPATPIVQTTGRRRWSPLH